VIRPDLLGGGGGEAVLSKIARAPQGSPTQKPSILPTRILATICGGGTTMVFTSLMGLMPTLASQ
jgi:hypothetical protein